MRSSHSDVGLPVLSQHSNLQLQYKFQVLLKGKKWPGFPRFIDKVQLLQV